MPPKRKFKKPKQVALKKRITMRLMAISLLVEKYIYKNKQMTIEQAQMYLEELTSLKSQCIGDAPSLQVCEKLTRCMKGIIEEQSNDAVLQNTEASLDFSQPSYPYAASPVYSLPDEDKTQMYSEPDVQVCHAASIISEENKEKNKDKKSVRFSMDIDHIATEYNNETCTTTNVVEKCNVNTDFNEHLHTFETYLHSTVNDELTNGIVDLNLEDVEPPINNNDLCSQSLLKNMDVVETPESIEDFLNNTCGQNMDEFDREVTKLIDPVSQEIKGYNKDNVHKTVLIRMAHNIPAPMNEVTNTFQTDENPTILNKNIVTNQTIKNKPSKDTKQKKTITKKKKENVPEKKRKIKSKPTGKIKGKDKSRLAFTPLTNYSEKTQLPVRKTDNKTNNEFNISTKAVKNIEILNENISNIVETPEANHFVESNKPNNSTVNGASRKTKACFEEDLSWVENLTYVREIQLEEYASGSKISDSFWDNCELPNNWDSRDFELL